MKVEEVKNITGAKNYIGKSKSLYKGWRVLIVKHQKIKAFKNSKSCPMYFVIKNRQSKCVKCPLWQPCVVGLFRKKPEQVIKYLSDNKHDIITNNSLWHSDFLPPTGLKRP
jgi:hypothetical protein